MPIRLKDLERDVRTCTVEYEGENAEVTYRPSAYTPFVEDKLQAAIESNRPSSGVARLLSSVLVGWEVLGEDGEAISTDSETLSALPSAFLFAVINAITEDMGTGREERKNSGGGSPRAASKGTARRGSLS
jgi:hypothetical protein